VSFFIVTSHIVTPEVIRPLDRPSPKNEKSVPLYGFDRAWRFIDSEEILKKSEKFLLERGEAG